MRFALPILASMASIAVAQTDSFGSCVTDCLTSSPISSQCDGDETGDALNKCVCDSLKGSDLLKCIKKCPDDEQGTYVDMIVPDDCADLFPNADENSSGNNNNNDDDDSDSDSNDNSNGNNNNNNNNDDKDDAAVGISAPIMMVAGGLVAALLL